MYNEDLMEIKENLLFKFTLKTESSDSMKKHQNEMHFIIPAIIFVITIFFLLRFLFGCTVAYGVCCVNGIAFWC